MAHDELDDSLRHALRAYNDPPPPPLDAMWSAIEARHFPPVARPAGWRRWTPAAAAAAAALVIGIGVGRYAIPAAPAGALPQVAGVVADDPTPAPARLDAPYDVATNRYLGQTAALLIALPSETRGSRGDRRFVSQARDLLVTTRLLLDSPAADDPDVRSLLSDLELVLAQIAQLRAPGGADSREEMDLITNAMEQREVLPRLRMVVGQIPNGD